MKKQILIFLLMFISLTAFAQQTSPGLMKQIMAEYPNSHFTYIMHRDSDKQNNKYCMIIWSIKKYEVDRDFLNTLCDFYEKESKAASFSNRFVNRQKEQDTLSYNFVSQKTDSDHLTNTDVGKRHFRNVACGGSLDVIGDSVSMVLMANEALKGKVTAFSSAPIDSLFNVFKRRKGTTWKDVQYTGANGSFDLQAGNGKGWTKGRRYTVPNVSKNEWNSFLELVEKYQSGSQIVNIILSRRHLAINDNSSQWKEAYTACLHDDGNLLFLHVKTDGSLCLPSNWDEITYFNNDGIEKQFQKK